MKKTNLITLAYCWLICLLAYALQQMTGELLTNGVLAKSLGASVDGWRMNFFDLAIHIKAFSLPERLEGYWSLTRALMALALGAACLGLEPRLTTFNGKLLALYWALWSLLAFLRPLLFSIFFAHNPLAGLWQGLPFGREVRQALGISLLLGAFSLLLATFRRGIILGISSSPARTFSARISVGLRLFFVPLLIATIMGLFRFPFFHLGEAWLPLALTLAALLVFPSLPALWRIVNTSSVPSPSRNEIVLAISVSVLLLTATPISRQFERMTNEHRLANLESEHFGVSYPTPTVAESSVVSFSQAAERTHADIAARIQLPHSSSRIHFIFFSNAEEKLFRHDSSERVDFDLSQNEIQLLFIPPFDHFEPPLLARFLLQKRFGDRRNPVLEAGLADLLTSPKDQPVTTTETLRCPEGELASVLEVEGPLSLQALLFSEDRESLSPFVSRPLAREFADFLQSRFGLDKLLALYSKEFIGRTADGDILNVLGISSAQLQTDWKKHCMERRTEFSQRLNQSSRPRPARPISFQKGMAFSAEGGARTGYMSEAASTSLDQLQQLGVEWISLMPFAFSSWDNTRPRLWFTHRNSWEGDDNLRRIAWEAHRRGIKIFLKPHVWLRGQSTVDFKVSDALAWHDWFLSYRRYILHQARLGEVIGAGLFSIGNELPLLTLDPAHEADWRTLISEVRRVFSGNITYCANWGEDFEQIRFADALDVVGLNAYYPLTAQPKASFDECRRGARAVADKVGGVSARMQRPIIITEIGYPSTTQAALRPWSEDGSELSIKAQAEAASAFLEAFWNQPWLRGIYWWKWYSHGRGGGEHDASYMPRGKPIAAVISEWYSVPRK